MPQFEEYTTMKKEKIQKELTKAELEVMQIIWEKKKVLAREVLDEMPEPKPAYNTVSTVIRVLEKKGFVSHKAFGTTTIGKTKCDESSNQIVQNCIF